jgi:hydroxymethylpyrimidine/phosphomethylpyrimidine kinase
LTEAVAGAGEYLRRAIATAPRLGRGHGPVDHSVAATIPSTSEPRRPPT